MDTHLPIIPIILAGGSGTRLWPLSRKNYPKQFIAIANQTESLLQQTYQRLSHLPIEECLIITNEDYYFLCQDQLPAEGTKIHYLLEPSAQNTAPAVAAAAYHISQRFENALMLIIPSDHFIEDTANWQKLAIQALNFAENNDKIITFGITPTKAHTGYGYIEQSSLHKDGFFDIARFHEKPCQTDAEAYLKSGRFFWNSGIFVASIKTYLQELHCHEPVIATHAKEAIVNSTNHHDFTRLDLEHFSKCPSLSIDYAIMEKTTESVLLPASMGWSDLGCWNSVAEINQTDSSGNALCGNVVVKETNDCFIKTDKTLVATLGIEHQIIIATEDAILIADKSRAQDVKQLVADLHLTHKDTLTDHLRVYRPWGYYEILAEGATFKVKRLMVKPGAKLSLQRHQHRAEHWVVIDGTAEVINGEELSSLSVNQSTYIPPKTMHRLSNATQNPLYLIEVQTGSYLGEDDIERFDDVYHRPKHLTDPVF